jgi:RimJ/RimL family protein N-acetyltransferase
LIGGAVTGNVGQYRDMEPVELIGDGGVRLRPYRLADVDDVVAGCADPLTQRFIPLLPNPYTRDDALWWINHGSASAWSSGGAAYAITDSDSDRLIGGIGLARVVAERHQGEIGYWVAPWARGRGIASAATRALTGWAFAQGFHRLELFTELENLASQRVALAAGFRREGVRRAVGRDRDGGWHDCVVWVRLLVDPAGPTPRLLPDLPRLHGAGAPATPARAGMPPTAQAAARNGTPLAAQAPTHDDRPRAGWVPGDPAPASLGGALTDGVITLRPLRPADAPAMYALHTLPDVVASSVPPIAPDREEVDLRCARSGARWLAGERADLVILDAASGEYAGEIGLYYQEPQTGQAMIGYSMLPTWRRRGYAARAARLLADWVFRHTGIGRLIAGTSPTNTGSQRVLERAGFRREGLLHGRLPVVNGTRVDDVLYALVPGAASPTVTRAQTRSPGVGLPGAGQDQAANSARLITP